MFVSHQKSKLFVIVNYGWILDFEVSNGQFFSRNFSVTDFLLILRIIFVSWLHFHYLWRRFLVRILVCSLIESSVLGTRVAYVFIFLLSVCNILLLLEWTLSWFYTQFLG